MSVEPPVAPVDSVLVWARRLWTELAGAPVVFPPAGQVNLAVSARSQLCRPGWAGLIVLGGAGIATAPDGATADLFRVVLRAVPVQELADRGRVFSMLPGVSVGGPSTLSYLDAGDYRPAHEAVSVEELPIEHDDLKTLLSAATTAEVAVSGLKAITSPAFVVRAGEVIAAAAGYRVWPHDVAHLNTLTAQEHRGRGLGRAATSAATAHALSHGLLPQARTHPVSLRMVAPLGFRLLGFQMSFMPEAPRGGMEAPRGAMEAPRGGTQAPPNWF